MTKKLIYLVGLTLLVAGCNSAGTSTPVPITIKAPTQPSETARPTITPTLTSTATKAPTSTITPTATITPSPALIAGAAPTMAPTWVYLVRHGDQEKPQVVLTFDLGANPWQEADFDFDILEALIEYDAPATFFVTGMWMEAYPEVTREMALNPLFDFGNHSYTHPNFPDLETEEISEEILKTNDLLYQLTGETTQFFRFPGGMFDDHSIGMVAYHGMLTVHWDVVTSDPLPDNDADNIVRIVMERVKNGSIIIMHGNGRGVHTAEALPEMIKQLRAAGYELVTLSELLAP